MPKPKQNDRKLSPYEIFTESEMYIRRSTLYVKVYGILGKLELKHVPFEHLQDLKCLQKFILANFTYDDIKHVVNVWNQNEYKVRFWTLIQEKGFDREFRMDYSLFPLQFKRD